MWAVVSEIARLAFMIFGNALCALIFWALAVAGFARVGIGPLSLTFFVLALVPTIFAALATRGIAVAMVERTRLRARTAPGGESR